MHSVEELVNISSAIAHSVDEVQGGGGNTSVKIDDETMLIKASGFELKQVSTDSGYVKVLYKKIQNFFDEVLTSSAYTDSDYSELIQGQAEGELRPSMETGFHAVLKAINLHSHSVYANLICCSKDGKTLLAELFSDLNYVYVPYVNPGLALSESVHRISQAYKKENGSLPDLVFLENHGLIVSSESDIECIALNKLVKKRILVNFPELEIFPELESLEAAEDGLFSKTNYINNFVESEGLDLCFNNVLFPDQVVYLNPRKLAFENNKVKYLAKEKEARIIDETLLSYVYLIKNLKKLKLGLKFLGKDVVNYLNNVETEKYRRKIAEN